MWREPLETFPAEAWDAVIDLNLKSPFWLVQALLPALRRAGTGDDPARVINIAVAPEVFPSQMMAATIDAIGDTIAAKAPLRRLGHDDDMAGVAVFLANRAGS